MSGSDSTFRAKFWGVRGSVPAPGPETAEFGGNTSCVEVRCGDTLLVFDAGTGLRQLGRSLTPNHDGTGGPPGGGPVTAHLFFSHVHWDHIQGFPFFAPAFAPGNTMNMYGVGDVTGGIESAMAGQMESPNFPVKLDQLPSSLVFHDVRAGEGVSVDQDIRVLTAAGNHPGGVIAYRVDFDGRSIVYMTDTEKGSEADAGLIKLAEGADVLIYDCQYTPEEYAGVDGPSKVGWGHSTFVGGTEMAKEAGAKQLILFHHDPDQSDDQVRAKERRAKELFPNSLAAYEGLVISPGTD